MVRTEEAQVEGGVDPSAGRVAAAVLGPGGRTERELRASAMERAAAIARGGEGSVQALEEVSHAALSPLIDKVARQAYRVTDEEIDALLAAGYTEDALFDVIVAAAVGSSLARRDAGLEAVAAWERAKPARG